MNPYRLPSIEELARLAAIASAGMKKRPSDAVAYAFKLWRESHAAIERFSSEEAGIPGLGSFERTLDQIDLVQQEQAARKVLRANMSMPPKFPATLEDFQRLIVKARTPADSTKRLRDFFCHSFAATEDDPGTAAARLFQRIKDEDKAGGSFSKQKWLLLGARYSAWWKDQRSSKAATSAAARVPTKRRKKQS